MPPLAAIAEPGMQIRVEEESPEALLGRRAPDRHPPVVRQGGGGLIGAGAGVGRANNDGQGGARVRRIQRAKREMWMHGQTTAVTDDSREKGPDKGEIIAIGAKRCADPVCWSSSSWEERRRGTV
jgi:hypothetical protein